MKVSILVFLCAASLVLLSLEAVAQDKSKSKERQDVEQASLRYEKEVEEAHKVYQEALQRARKKFLDTYDTAITAALKKGGGAGLDEANQLRTEKKEFAQQAEADAASGQWTPPPSLERMLKLLVNRTWYIHWEKEDRSNPIKYLINGSTIDPKQKRLNPNSWHVERKWVVTTKNHYYIMIDDNRFRGFLPPPDGQWDS